MSNASDFIIENGVLKKYVGPGGDVVIPDGVASIGAKVFGTAKGVESVFLPDSVTAIGDRAFYGVPLDKVHIPDSVLKIKEYVFRETSDVFCSQKPKSIVFAGKVLIRYRGQAKKYKIPDGTRAIADRAVNAPSLEHIVIPDSVAYIGSDAFSGCNHLKTIEISAQTVERIGKNAIKAAFFKLLPQNSGAACDYEMNQCFLTNVLINDTQLNGLEASFMSEIRREAVRKDLAVYFIGRAKSTVALARLLSLQTKIPQDEITSYLDLAERCGASEAKAVILSVCNGQDAVKKTAEKQRDDLEMSAADWKKLLKFSYTDKGVVISGYKGTDGTMVVPPSIGKHPVVAIKESAFAFTDYVEKVVLSDGVTTIGAHAFNTSELKEITIPASVTEIGDGAFYATLVTIHAPSGSYAETYAKENNIPFVAE